MAALTRLVQCRGVQGIVSVTITGDLSFQPTQVKRNALANCLGRDATSVEICTSSIVGASTEQLKKNAFKVWYCPVVTHKSTQKRRQLLSTPLFECTSSGEADELVKHIRKTSSGWTQTHAPRVMAIVNPHSGQSRARSMFNAQVRPILEAAGIQVDLQETSRPQHATELVQQLNLDSCDMLLMVGGDGTMWEALQGLLGRPDWRRAAQLPLAAIPAGSGNGLAASCGLWDAVTAAHAVVKGRLQPLDIASVLQLPGQRYYSFLSMCFGLMSNLDHGTNNLRWAGEARFTYGAVREIMRGEEYALRCWYLPHAGYQPPGIAPPDLEQPLSEEAVAPMLPAGQASSSTSVTFTSVGSPVSGSQPLTLSQFPEGPDCPALAALPGLADNLTGPVPAGWRALPSPLQHFMLVNPTHIATKFKYNAQGGLQTGYFNLDWVRGLKGLPGRLKGLQMLTKAEAGEHTSLPWVNSDKVVAMAFEPISDRTWLLVDGEAIPSRTVFLEVHPALCNVLVAP